jgi:hypothetical protein
VDLFDRIVRASKRLGPLPECPRRVVADSVRLNGLAYSGYVNGSLFEVLETVLDNASRSPLCLTVFPTQQAIRDEIKKMQAADQHLSFTLAWNRLMKQRPELFDFEEPKRGPVTASSAVGLGKRMIRAQVGRDLKEKVEALRMEQPELSFADAWAELRKREPELFRYARGIENGEWGPPKTPAKVFAANRSAVVVQGGFATRLC